MIEVYVDTSALLTMLNDADEWHPRTLDAARALSTQSVCLVTSSYTLVEASSLARSRLGMRAVRLLGSIVDAYEHIVWVDSPLHRRAWSEVSNAGRNGPSLVDWVGFLVMRDRGIDTALAIDGHFNDQGFKTLP